MHDASVRAILRAYTPIQMHAIHTKCACTRVRRAARALTDSYDEALKPLGLKVTQFSLVRTVDRLGAPSLTGLAQEMALDRSTLGRNVAVLERMGLLDRSDGADLREACLHEIDLGGLHGESRKVDGDPQSWRRL